MQRINNFDTWMKMKGEEEEEEENLNRFEDTEILGLEKGC